MLERACGSYGPKVAAFMLRVYPNSQYSGFGGHGMHMNLKLER